MKKYKWFLLIFLIVFLSSFAVWPVIHSGFFPMHDDTQVTRIDQMTQVLKDGQFPVRWVQDLGYGFGYPIFNFYAPLAYYVGGFFELLGFNALAATKMMFLLGIILSGIFMFLFARELWGDAGGLVSALFYIYAPYHAVDIYVRGAAGEFWAVTFLPLLFLGIFHLFNNKHKERKGIIISTLGFSGIILSHNLTAMMTIIFLLPLFVILFCLSKYKKSFSANSFLFIFFSFGLSAFYWLPALVEMGYTKILDQIGGGADFRDHFVFLDQLWASPWGFGGSAPGRLDGMSFMIGKLHIFISAVSLFMAIWLWKKNRKKTATPILISLFFLLFSIFLTNEKSKFVWESVKIFSFIQYPWRFLVFATFLTSFLAGSIFFSPGSFFKKNSLFSLSAVLITIISLLLLNRKYFRPQYYLNVTSNDYTNMQATRWKVSKISDEYLPKDFPIPKSQNEIANQKILILEGDTQIKNLNLKSHQYSFEVLAKTNTQILVNTAYFPGWKLWIDSKQTEFFLFNGKIKFFIVPGNHQIILKFTNTPIRTISNLTSFICLMGTIWLMLKYKNGRN